MNQLLYSVTVLALAFPQCLAFSAPRAFTVTPRCSSEIYMAIDLIAEPAGGEEMAQIDPMEGSRMKNMGKSNDDNVTSDDGSDVHSFWMTAEADGSFVKQIRTKLLKEAGKNANFPGFRKGQVPPYAQPQMTLFAVQEGIIQTCQSAVIAYGLKSIGDDDGGSVEVLEDIKDLVKGYKIGDNVKFTANFAATFDEEKQAKLEEATPASFDAEPVDNE